MTGSEPSAIVRPSLDHQPLRNVRKATSVPPTAMRDQAPRRGASSDERVESCPMASARVSATPWKSGVNHASVWTICGQLLDREERAAEQEQRRDDEAEDDRERLLGLARARSRRPCGMANATPVRTAAGQAKIDGRRGDARRTRKPRSGRRRSRCRCARSASKMAEHDVAHALRRRDHGLERLVPAETGDERPRTTSPVPVCIAWAAMSPGARKTR